MAAAPAALARERKPRRIVVAEETLYISRVLKEGIAVHLRLSDWARAFKRQGAAWREATRHRRLRGGTSSDDTLHIGRKPISDQGYRWLIRLSRALNGPPAARPAVAMNDGDDGFRLSVERVGARLANRVLAATKLPNGHTLEVTAEVVEAKGQVPFEVLTWEGGPPRGAAPPTGAFVVRNGRGLVVARGDLRDLWRRARS